MTAIALLAGCHATDPVEHRRIAPAVAATAPPMTTWAEGVDPAWTPSPRCFAHSPTHRAYACLGWIAEGDGPRIGSIDLVGRSVLETYPVWLSTGERPDAAAIDARLAALGFVGGALSTRPMPANTWITIDGVELYYRSSLHEGDASFEYLGDLQLRCPADGPGAEPRVIDVRRMGLELGEDAVASWSPGSGTIAISVHGIDGGEGTELHVVNTIVLDDCATSGPLEGRSIGP